MRSKTSSSTMMAFGDRSSPTCGRCSNQLSGPPLLITPSSPEATEFHAVKNKPQGTVGFPLTTLFFALLLTQPAVLRQCQPRWRLVGAGWRALLKSCPGWDGPLPLHQAARARGSSVHRKTAFEVSSVPVSLRSSGGLPRSKFIQGRLAGEPKALVTAVLSDFHMKSQ